METDGNSWGIACKDEISGALTCNMAILEADASEAIVKFDVRYPVTHDSDQLTARLEGYAYDLGSDTKYELVQHKKPLYVEKDRPFIKNCKRPMPKLPAKRRICFP